MAMYSFVFDGGDVGCERMETGPCVSLDVCGGKATVELPSCCQTSKMATRFAVRVGDEGGETHK